MTAPEAIARQIVGFLEEAPGRKSSTRLYAGIMLAAACVLALGFLGYSTWCAKHNQPADATICHGFEGIIGTFIVQGCVAVILRTKTTDNS